jgi:hypothetical protein
VGRFAFRVNAMNKLTTFVLVTFIGALALLLALSTLAAAGAALASATSVLGLVCLAGLLGAFGLVAGLALGAFAMRWYAGAPTGITVRDAQPALPMRVMLPAPRAPALPGDHVRMLAALADVYRVPVEDDDG